MRLKLIPGIYAATLLAISPAWALDVGDPAPPLAVERWVSGPAVSDVGQSGDTVYVVAFWAPWSKPSTASLLTLSETQRAVGDSGVVVVAIAPTSVREVEEVIEKGPRFGRLKIRIGVDDDQKTTWAYLRAAGKTALPHAFVVNKEGIIAWQGHPDDVRGVLDQIVAGEFKIEGRPKRSAGAEIDQALVDEFSAAIAAQDWHKVIEVIDTIISRYPDSPDAEELMGRKFILLYEDLKDYGAARSYAQELLSRHADRGRALNNVAWSLLARGDFETLGNRWPEIAHDAAKKAYEATSGEDAAVLDTYARSLYLLGNVDQAIETQRQAVKKFRDGIEEVRPSQPDAETLGRFNAVLEDMEAALEYYEEVKRLRRSEGS